MEVINGFGNTSSNIIKQNQDIKLFGSISFNPDAYTIVGKYFDEISLFRAKKFWAQAFEDVFLLEKQHDFKFSAQKSSDSNEFTLSCQFLSACGRYAFWRINNNQNPEVKYLIEVSHMPSTFQNYDEIINSMPKFNITTDSDILNNVEEKTNNISEILKKIVSKICKKDKEEN